MAKGTLRLSPSDELRILRKIVDITTTETELPGVLNEVVKTVSDIAAADSVLVFLLSEDKRSLILQASKRPHKMELGVIQLKAGEGVAGWVAKTVRPVAIREKAYEDARFKSFKVLPEDRYEALLSVPIIYKGKAVGVINVQHKQPHEYHDNVVNLLSVIARQLGGVIEHARLFTETREKASQFDALAKVSSSITSEKYLDDILKLIVLITAEMLDSKICSIMILDPAKQELSIKATQSLSEEYKRKPNLKISSSLLGEVIRTRRPLAVEDVRHEKRYYYRNLAVKEGLSSMLAVPMVVKDQAVGVINIYTKQSHVFKDDEINALQMIANQAAVAIENARWMDEAVKAKEALQARKVVERAKGVLMRKLGLSEEAAYQLIHKKSMDACKTMREISESILLTADLHMGRSG